ncbi:uncharacterized protein LOC128296598 [Gossypium arboreum]|uniref:uncharacterized protein LOC128296598 n=1 Tax=Gossypium arboreum TaxID=29729 RepID=UPI0022F15645|nr:uncharacterized protein LOC128296598 [Gossypium arboreum]
MPQIVGQFSGMPTEDHHLHLRLFMEVSDSFKLAGVPKDALRLKLFPYSLRDRARAWNRPPSALPSDTENLRNLRKEHCKSLTLRSGERVEPNTIEAEKEQADAQESEEDQPSVEIPISQEPESAKPDKVISELANSDQLTTLSDAELP